MISGWLRTRGGAREDELEEGGSGRDCHAVLRPRGLSFGSLARPVARPSAVPAPLLTRERGTIGGA